MVIHTCQTCFKEFTKKSTYTDHINKKIPCVAPKIINQTNPKLTKNTTKKADLVNENNIEVNCQCDYCDKTFFNIYSLKRHLDGRCKVKKEDDINKDNIFKLLLEKEELIKTERKEKEKEKAINNELKTKVDDLQIKLDELTKTIKELTNKTIKNINKGVINKGVINNITITSEQLSKFGKEDLSKITQQEFLKIRNQQGIAIFKECAKLIYNNKPFNRTVYVADHSRKKAMIWSGKDWILSDIDEVIYTVKEKIRDFYSINLDNLEDEKIIKDFETRIQKYFDMLYDEYADEKEDDKQFMERAKGLQDKFEKDLIKWLFNIKQEVIDNYNGILQSIINNNIKLIEQKKLV